MNQLKFTEKYASTKAIKKRYTITLDFLDKNISKDSKILDLGIENPFSDLLKERGYNVLNTDLNQDLDDDFHQVEDASYDVVTAFEIFEHLVAPYNVLKAIKADTLVASVPLKLWFTKAYWNEKDPWDRHYHEFEPRQFDMVLEKAGWEIVDSMTWASYDSKLGVRPILRRFFPRYYLVCCKRKKA